MNNPNRPLEIAAFLDRSGWGGAEAQGMDGDFSTRRYARLTKEDGAVAILMDEDQVQNTLHFVAVAALLRQTGITVPEVYEEGADRGLLLLQDFGARNVGALLDAGEASAPFYLRAAELLAQLHKNFDVSLGPDLPLYNAALFTDQATLFLDTYMPYALQREATEEERTDFRAAWQVVLRPLDSLPKSLLLRDFMPDNLMDLPGGRLGVLDFQDAGMGPVAYDLASLCETVRRDGGFELLPDVIAHYHDRAASPISQSDLLRASVILSAQRHTRILGIIARFAVREGRQEKLALLPRIREHLTRILQKPYLMPVREWMERIALP